MKSRRTSCDSTRVGYQRLRSAVILKYIVICVLNLQLLTDGKLQLPVMVNHKTADPKDKSSTPVVRRNRHGAIMAAVTAL